MEDLEFNLGDGVRLSEPGRRKSRSPDRHGRIVGVSATGTSFRVRWAGLQRTTLIHRTFLEPDQRPVVPAVLRRFKGTFAELRVRADVFPHWATREDSA